MTTLQLGPQSGSLKVNTYREGVAQKIGHDLVIEVEEWDATVDVGPHGAIRSVQLNVDPSSLRVSEGRGGAKAVDG